MTYVFAQLRALAAVSRSLTESRLVGSLYLANEGTLADYRCVTGRTRPHRLWLLQPESLLDKSDSVSAATLG